MVQMVQMVSNSSSRPKLQHGGRIKVGPGDVGMESHESSRSPIVAALVATMEFANAMGIKDHERYMSTLNNPFGVSNQLCTANRPPL